MPGSKKRDPSLERTYVVGGTGSGKSELAAYLTRGCSRLLVYDTKNDLGGLLGAVVVSAPEELTFRRREVFQPLGADAMDPQLVDRVMQCVMLAGNVVVWVDECSEVSTPQAMPPWMGAVLRQGRSKGIGVIALTQRDVGASHKEFFAQAQHAYVGHSSPVALEKLKTRLGPDVLQASQLGYASGRFLLFWDMQQPPRLVGPVRLGTIRSSKAY